MANTPTSTSPTTPARSGTAGNTTPDLKADANAAMDEAKSAAGKVVDEAKSAAGVVAHEVKEQAATLAERAKAEVGDATAKVKSMAADQKDMVAEQVDGVAQAVSRAASELEASNGSTAQYARMIADHAEKLSSTIRDNDVDQLLGLAQDFGRRQPVLFMGAAALLGFAASRFVTASAKRVEDKAANGQTDTTDDFAGTTVADGASNGTRTAGTYTAGGY